MRTWISQTSSEWLIAASFAWPIAFARYSAVLDIDPGMAFPSGRMRLSDRLNRRADIEPPIIGQQEKPFRHVPVNFAGFFRLTRFSKL
jgi:hypothetical protein